jgi:outer membrane protein assembly factor BamB
MTLYCLDLATFKTVWQYTNDYKSKAKRSDTYNGTTTLAYDNSRLYCTFNYYHKYNGIICFDPLTGKELWRKDGFDEQPVGYNDCLFLIDTDHKTQKLSTSLSILNCKTGDIQKLIGPFEGSSYQRLSIDKSKFILSFNEWYYPDEGKYVESFMKVYDY